MSLLDNEYPESNAFLTQMTQEKQQQQQPQMIEAQKEGEVNESEEFQGGIQVKVQS